MTLIPATIITGFLGSGKSTLLRKILTENHGRKIAVIENEFGEENIDNEIIVSGGQEQIIIMNNGCVCCSIREDLRATLCNLYERRNIKQLYFDHIIIETTGIADPGPVAQTFFLNDQISSKYRLDAILTMVDAKHAIEQLNTRLEAQRQVGFADRIFISKADLVEQSHINVISARVQKINSRAPQSLVSFGNVKLTDVFDIGGFNLSSKLDISFDTTYNVNSHDHNHNNVQSFVFRTERPIHGTRFSRFMNALIISYGSRLLRYKGIINISEQPQKVILQGVYQLINYDVGEIWDNNETRISKLVFIGIGMPKDIIMNNLQKCLI